MREYDGQPQCQDAGGALMIRERLMDLLQVAPLREHQDRDALLVRRRKSRNIAMLNQIRRVLARVVVGNSEPDLVQQRGPP